MQYNLYPAKGISNNSIVKNQGGLEYVWLFQISHFKGWLNKNREYSDSNCFLYKNNDDITETYL